MAQSMAEHAAETITKGIGRRGFIQAVAALGAGVGIAGTAACSTSSSKFVGTRNYRWRDPSARSRRHLRRSLSEFRSRQGPVGLRPDGRVRVGAADEVR